MSPITQADDREISEVTRRAIIDHFVLSGTSWSGRMSDGEFLARLYDLPNMRSMDHRFRNAAQDIYQHTARNDDWERDWVFYDERFNLLRGVTSEFLRFLCETVHPIVRSSADETQTLVAIYNDALAADGWRITEGQSISGKPTFVPIAAGRAVVFEEPTGWMKVDRQLQEMRLRLDTAGTEEQYQSVGLLCREALISVAQEVFDPSRHPHIDDVKPSTTDARRMLEAIFSAELGGESNDEARRHAKTAVNLALALQHKRMADFRTAALCAEGTWSVVNMLAIVAGRRSRYSEAVLR